MTTSLLHSSISFFIELIFLNWEFFKCMFWTVFYLIFSPTEKYVRNEIVLITGMYNTVRQETIFFYYNPLVIKDFS